MSQEPSEVGSTPDTSPQQSTSGPQQSVPTGPSVTPQQPFQGTRQQHPQSTVVLVLGILSVVFCQLTGPFAWYLGSKALKEIEANPGVYSGDGEIRIGQILGIVGTILLVLLPLFMLAVIGFSLIGIFMGLAGY